MQPKRPPGPLSSHWPPLGLNHTDLLGLLNRLAVVLFKQMVCLTCARVCVSDLTILPSIPKFQRVAKPPWPWALAGDSTSRATAQPPGLGLRVAVSHAAAARNEAGPRNIAGSGFQPREGGARYLDTLVASKARNSKVLEALLHMMIVNVCLGLSRLLRLPCL